MAEAQWILPPTPRPIRNKSGDEAVPGAAHFRIDNTAVIKYSRIGRGSVTVVAIEEPTERLEDPQVAQTRRLKLGWVHRIGQMNDVSSSAVDIVVIQGDISRETADALVSPDDTELSMSGGASAALRDGGGPELYEAAEEASPLNVGDVAVTPAFELFAEYVVHAASKPVDGSATAESVRAAAESAFDAADEYGCQSVVVPLLGSGVGGLTTSESVGLVCDAAVSSTYESLEEIRLVTRGSGQYRESSAIVAEHRSD